MFTSATAAAGLVAVAAAVAGLVSWAGEAADCGSMRAECYQ